MFLELTPELAAKAGPYMDCLNCLVHVALTDLGFKDVSVGIRRVTIAEANYDFGPGDDDRIGDCYSVADRWRKATVTSPFVIEIVGLEEPETPAPKEACTAMEIA